MTLVAQAYVHVLSHDSEMGLERSIDLWEAISTDAVLEIYQGEFDLDLTVEAGSRRLWASVIAVGHFFANYGDIRSGLDAAIHDARRFGSMVASGFVERAQIPASCVYRVERRLAVPGRLQRVLRNLEASSRSEQGMSARSVRETAAEIEDILATSATQTIARRSAK